MDIRMDNGLLLVSCTLTYESETIFLQNVLLDTGCAVSVFDIDLMECIGLSPNLQNAQIVRMYGIGGKSEPCLEQWVQKLVIGDHECRHFLIQLGPILEDFGFDAILGNDFLMASGLTIDFHSLVLFNKKSPEISLLN